MKRGFIKLMFSAMLVVLLFGCTSDSDFDTVKRQLEAQGYTEVTQTGYAAWCCGEDYSWKTGWEALDPNDDRVSGCACSDFLKGVSIKFN